MSLQGAEVTLVEAGRPSEFVAGTSFARHFDDYDEMAANAPNWQQEYLKIGRENAGGTLRAAQTACMQLGIEEYHTGLLARGTSPPDCFTFLFQTGGCPFYTQGLQLTANDVGVLSADTEFAGFSRGPSNIVTLALTEEYLRHQVHVLAHRDVLAKCRSAPSLRLDDFGNQKLVEAVTRVVHLTLFKPRLLTNQGAAKRFEEEIASLLVSNFTSPTDYEAPSVRHRAARRALDYIRANAEDLLTINDLCREIGASQRTLEIGFQELYGMSPKAYLTLLRLHRARQELLSSDHTRVTVTEVATHWGFYHFGRFAGAYRERYGETPIATIKRRGVRHLLARQPLLQDALTPRPVPLSG